MSESLLPQPTKGEIMKTSRVLWELHCSRNSKHKPQRWQGGVGWLPRHGDNLRLWVFLIQTTSQSSRPLLEPNPQNGLFRAPLTIRLGFRFFQFVKSVTTHPSASLVPECCCYSLLIHFSLFLWVFALKSLDCHFGGIPRRNTGECGLTCCFC